MRRWMAVERSGACRYLHDPVESAPGSIVASLARCPAPVTPRHCSSASLTKLHFTKSTKGGGGKQVQTKRSGEAYRMPVSLACERKASHQPPVVEPTLRPLEHSSMFLLAHPVTSLSICGPRVSAL